MKLEDAESLHHLHPEEAARIPVLEAHLTRFQAEFYNNVLALRRIAAWENANGELKSEQELVEIARMLVDEGNSADKVRAAMEQLTMAREKAQTEANLDAIRVAIETTQSELDALKSVV